MAEKYWSLDDIPWETFDSSKVDPEIVKVVKAASMVEYNGGDYAAYLCNVFPDDPPFQAAARAWAEEEVQHGQALARWAELADAGFDFQDAFRRFTEGYSLPVGATQSVRGSRTGELVARCIVEVGTSSYYAALGSTAQEPVLKAICKHIAADELRHYKLFYTHLKRYLEKENVGRWKRLLVALSRINETEDDELAYAYYAANGDDRPYHRKRWSKAYARRAYGFYRRTHVERAVAMSFKAAGLNPQSKAVDWVAGGAYRFIKWREGRLAAANA